MHYPITGVHIKDVRVQANNTIFLSNKMCLDIYGINTAGNFTLVVTNMVYPRKALIYVQSKKLLIVDKVSTHQLSLAFSQTIYIFSLRGINIIGPKPII